MPGGYYYSAFRCEWPTATFWGLGSPRERGRTRPNEDVPFCVLRQVPPPIYKQKRAPQAPRTCDATRRLPTSGFPPGFPARCSPDRARVCARPEGGGSPTEPVPGPWLFSTAEARTRNSPSSSSPSEPGARGVQGPKAAVTSVVTGATKNTTKAAPPGVRVLWSVCF